MIPVLDTLPPAKLARIHWVSVHGVEVLNLNFRQASPAEALTMLEDYRRILKDQAPESVRILSEVASFGYDAGISNKWKAARREFDAMVRASAIVGAQGLMAVAVKSFISFFVWMNLPRAKTKMRLFENRDEALQWLIKT